MVQTLGEALPDPVLDTVHEWLSRRARRGDGVVRGDWLDLIHRIARATTFSVSSVTNTMNSLLDTGCIEKVDAGVLVTEKFSGTFRSGGFAAPDRDNIGPKALGWRGLARAKRAPLPPEAAGRPASDSYVQSEVPQYDPEPRCPQSRVVVLARTTFPSLCLDAGIPINPLVFSWRRLAKGINRWQSDYGVDLNFVRLMMMEFVRHPDWCQTSRRCPDEVFISRREKLAGLVLTRQQRDPSNRRHSTGAEYWPGL